MTTTRRDFLKRAAVAAVAAPAVIAGASEGDFRVDEIVEQNLERAKKAPSELLREELAEALPDYTVAVRWNFKTESYRVEVRQPDGRYIWDIWNGKDLQAMRAPEARAKVVRAFVLRAERLGGPAA